MYATFNPILNRVQDDVTRAGASAPLQWKLVEVTDEFPSLPRGLPEAMLRVWAFEVTGWGSSAYDEPEGSA
ncbi:MAG: hypothetical protein O3C10_12570 [Chloroflexi bacterium]|nr:hypothetical protein [Chloroflexota bacterium]